MNAINVKQGLLKLSNIISFRCPAMGWYFSSDYIENSFAFKKAKWVCMFMYFRMAVKKARPIRFSADYGRACTGPAEYFGFRELIDDQGEFIADIERFKKTRSLAREYYKQSLECIRPPKADYLYMESIENIEDNREIEVVNLFPDVTGLAKLAGLSSYDRKDNMDNVVAPFASGCQSVFTVPYNEKFQENPKSIIGLMDPLARSFAPDELNVISVPANRFLEMIDNIKGSFLDE